MPGTRGTIVPHFAAVIPRKWGTFAPFTASVSPGEEEVRKPGRGKRRRKLLGVCAREPDRRHCDSGARAQIYEAWAAEILHRVG